MGTTDSRQKPSLERQYKLVRRFMSSVYGGGQVTVIEHKQTGESFVLRQFVNQVNVDRLVRELEGSRSVGHRNLIQLRRFWVENDVNICSSLSKIYAVFDYHENTLEELMEEKRGRGMTDGEVADFVRQMGNVFNFLERNKIFWLLAGARSIAVAVEKEEVLKQRNANLQVIHQRSWSRFEEEVEKKGRRSMVVGGDYFRKGGEDMRVSFKKESFVNEPSSQSQRRIYKIFDPLQGISANRSIHKLQKYLQGPIHPNIPYSSEHALLSDVQVRQQNNLTVGMIALTMCEGCQFDQLDVFKNGRLSVSKYNRHIEGLRGNYPKTVKELEKMSIVGISNGSQQRMSQGLKIKDVSLLKKMKEVKENVGQSWGEVTMKKTLGNQGIRSSYKRISLCQL